MGEICFVVPCYSETARPLGGGGDSRGGGSHVLRLSLSLSSDRLGRLLSGGNLSGSLLSLGLGIGSLGSLLLGSLSLDGLVLSLGGGLALDGGTELGEGAQRRLLLALSGRGRLVTLAKGEGKRRLALLLDVLLGLAIGSGGSRDFRGLDGNGGRVGNVNSQGSGGLNGRNDGSGLSGSGDLSLLGGLSGLNGLSLGGLLLLLAENTTEEAVALGSSRLLLRGLLSLRRLDLNRLVLSDGGSDRGVGNDLSSRGLLNLGGLNLGGFVLNSRDNSLGGDDGSGLLGLDLVLLLLLLAEAEERSALAASRAALGLLSLELLLGSLLGGLLLLDSLLNLGGLLGLGSLLLDRLGLLLNGGNGLEALKSLLVGLSLDNGGAQLLGLSNLELELGNPVVALSGGGGLEGVLVALGSQVELVGAIGLGLSGISLEKC